MTAADLQGSTVTADLVWTGGRFEAGVTIEIDADGRIAGISRDRAARHTLRHRALLPGFVNAHSHAFQRGLRGHGESFPEGAGSFWSWREEMYRLVGSLDRSGVYELSLQAFREMRRAGITTVGEFHYLHHDDAEAAGGQGDFAFDRVVLHAAAAAGIRVALLSACYETGGPGRPLDPAQRRFRTASPAVYWRQMDALAAEIAAGPHAQLQSLGAVVHSLRAAPPETAREIRREAARRGLPLHLHVEEQRREIEEIEAAHGRRPMAILLEDLDPSPALTAVHCTHTTPAHLEAFTAAGARVCVCPLTEANLGDGLPELPASAAGRLCLGTDSNARISMLEEMRWLEYGQRLRAERRGALRGDDGRVAPVLLDAATRGGAAALGLEAGAIEPGLWADFAAIDLDHPSLAGATPETLPEALVFGAGDEVIAGTWVAGHGEPTR